MASVWVQDLAGKVRLLKVHAGLDQKDVAAAIGVKPQTLNTWINGADKRERGQTPQGGLEKLAALLVDRARRPVDLAAARDAWLGPSDAFARLFLPGGRDAFLSLFEGVSSAGLLHYLENGVPERGLVASPYGAARKPDRNARIGDIFALELRGSPGAWGAVFVETPAGIYLIGPDAARGRASSMGILRIPDQGLAPFEYQEPPGPHRFLAVMITGGPAPVIFNEAGAMLPLTEDDLAAFVSALHAERPARTWTVDGLCVHVAP